MVRDLCEQYLEPLVAIVVRDQSEQTVGVIKKFPFRIVLRARLSKTLRFYYGANCNYGSPSIYSVIARFIRVNNACD